MEVRSESEFRFPILLRSCWFGLNKALRTRLRKLNLTTAQYTTLRSINENEGVSQNQLARFINSNKSNTGSIISRLIKMGLVRQQVSGNDRRVHQLFLTEYGNEVFSAAKVEALRLNNDILEVINKDNEAKLVDYLERITKSITG